VKGLENEAFRSVVSELEKLKSSYEENKIRFEENMDSASSETELGSEKNKTILEKYQESANLEKKADFKTRARLVKEILEGILAMTGSPGTWGLTRPIRDLLAPIQFSDGHLVKSTMLTSGGGSKSHLESDNSNEVNLPIP
jgi:hypothetical protein